MACCGRYLGPLAPAAGSTLLADEASAEIVPAPDAEALMRSRYCAFVERRADYLLETWHPGSRPDQLEFDDGMQWLGLEVRGHWPSGADRAEVEFVARYRLAGRVVRLHERSRFVREAGRWYYIDAV